MPKSIEELSNEIYENNLKLGWRGPTSEPRTFGDDIALIHSEISEALECFRDYHDTYGHFEDLQGIKVTIAPDDHDYCDNKPLGVPSELADAMIRIMDTAKNYGIDLQAEIEAKMAYNTTRAFRHGGKSL